MTAKRLLRRRAGNEELRPALEEENRKAPLCGVWKRALGALRGGREVRSKEIDPKEARS